LAEVRFRNNGLDSIEVQDNGSGIAPENYESIGKLGTNFFIVGKDATYLIFFFVRFWYSTALKHYTSKLSTFDDLTSLTTFGFRGEAISSLCALSDFHIVTAQADQAPKANKLEFEVSGKLKQVQVVAGQKGITASVRNLFCRLPVRRRELEKNIKREYGKVLNLLHAYTCISTGVRFSVKNTVGKAKNVVVFATKANPTTKENIANVYGAKTLLALIPLDLVLEFEPSAAGRRLVDRGLNKIHVRGHVSRPVFGEGRQTPDRQMFFVNSRPCGLPQVAKAFNEVYKSFNVSQSPFVFADFQMDTNAYDVNVSPDKRTILLHDSGPLIESLKDALNKLFAETEQTVPQSQFAGSKHQVGIKQHLQKDLQEYAVSEQLPETSDLDQDHAAIEGLQASSHSSAANIHDEELDGIDKGKVFSLSNGDQTREEIQHASSADAAAHSKADSIQDMPDTINEQTHTNEPQLEYSISKIRGLSATDETTSQVEKPAHTDEQQIPTLQGSAPSENPNIVQNAFDRMRPRRPPAEIATITIGDKTITSVVGSGPSRHKRDIASTGLAAGARQSKRRIHTPSRPNIFGQSLKSFAAPGTQAAEGSDGGESEKDRSDVEEEIISEASGSEEPELPIEDPEASLHDEDATANLEYDASNRLESENAHEISGESDEEYVDEAEKKAQEEAKVEALIRVAEEKTVFSTENHINRAKYLTKGQHARRDSTAHLVGKINGSVSRIEAQMETLRRNLQSYARDAATVEQDEGGVIPQESSEERLSLTVSKDDFAQMRIVGQFNLGFILATRSAEDAAGTSSTSPKDELFIIDQHASDEKYNFERLQAETVVQNQRLVRPKRLDLTAVEEEIIIENQAALEKNGFVVEVDESGDEPIGRRCKLVSLPLSKEVVFDVRDLEELIVLLGESPGVTTTADRNGSIPRPSKVRKMFAMRACRSSIMIGKTLTVKQMEKVVRHMGTIDKPWNCPHGRPTMRHLMTLGQWKEYDEYSRDDVECGGFSERFVDWQAEMDEEGEQGDGEGDG
jgi:DNA mismatch repair protein PMS2